MKDLAVLLFLLIGINFTGQETDTSDIEKPDVKKY